MTREDRQLLDDIRTKHPCFHELEQHLRRRWPHLDELAAGLAVCTLIELLDDAEAATLESANPGLDGVQ